MKRILPPFLALIAVVSAFSGVVLAQNNKKTSTVAQTYVISAKAGGVNYVEGQVAVLRKTGKSGILIKGDRLEIGDKVSTAEGAKAEILLNPGSYIRLDEKTNFEFEDTSLDDLKLKLTRGSAIMEVFADEEFKVTVATPKTQFYAIKSGVYRVDVISDGTAKLEVWKGKAQIGDVNATILKGGREAVVNAEQVAVAKFDRDDKDDLEVWSRTRAKELAKLNAKLERNNLRNSLLSTFRSGRGWSVYDSFGLWVYDASISGYCFLPFGYGWSSPYGFTYGRSIWNYGLPNAVFYQRSPSWGNNTGNNNGNINRGNNGGNNNGNNPRINPPPTVPPFERIQNGGGGNGEYNDIMPPLRKGYEPRNIDIAPMPKTPSSIERGQPNVPRVELKDN